MGRRGVLALVTATSVLASIAHAGEAAAPERLSLAKRLELGVVAVEARVGGDQVLASGTVVDAERGLILTSARSVWGATSLKLDTGLGILHGRIIARAPCDELALRRDPAAPAGARLADRQRRPRAHARGARHRLRPPPRRAGQQPADAAGARRRDAAGPRRAARPGGRRRSGARRRGPPDRDRRGDRRDDGVVGDRAAARGAAPGRAARLRRLEGPVQLRRAAAPAHARGPSRLPRERRAADRARSRRPASPARGGSIDGGRPAAVRASAPRAR